MKFFAYQLYLSKGVKERLVGEQYARHWEAEAFPGHLEWSC